MFTYCLPRLVLCLFVLAFLHQATCYAENPSDQMPEFMGDFFFVDDVDQQSPPLKVLSTEMKLIIPRASYHGFAEDLRVEYRIRNNSERDSFELAVIGENITIEAGRSNSPFTAAYVPQNELPLELTESLISSFDYYHGNEQIPVKSFEFHIAPNETKLLRINYKNSRRQFCNYYDDVCIFNFWLNPRFDYEIGMNLIVDKGLDTTAIRATKRAWINNPQLLEFSHNLKRSSQTDGVLSIRFPFIAEEPEQKKLSERCHDFLAFVDKAFPRKSLFGL